MRIPLVTEIQRYCLQDGPGIRSTVFLKGCPLKCPWCHNPETLNVKPEYYFYQEKCVGCGKCVEVCPTGAIKMVLGPKGQPIAENDRDKCEHCMKCVDACKSGARERVGIPIELDRLLKELLSDKLFYKNSGGGVTFSGGEPLYFPEFTRMLMQELKKDDIHIAIETSAYRSWKVLKTLLEYVDLFIVDIKTMDPEKYKKTIGCSIDVVLDNIKNLIDNNVRLRIHLPIIPDFNDSEEDFQKYRDFFEQYADGIEAVDLLPFHCYASSKYDRLGKGQRYKYREVKDKDPAELVEFARSLRDVNVQSITIGGMVGVEK